MNQNRKILRFLSFLLWVFYGCLVIYFVLFSDRLGRTDGYSTYRYNIIPFEEIRRFIVYRNQVSVEAFLINLIGNFLVFFPLGFLIPIWRFKKTGGIQIILFSFFFSLCIETMQLMTKVGVFDVDDLIMNTVGGLLGWICYCLTRKVYHRILWSKGNSREGQ